MRNIRHIIRFLLLSTVFITLSAYAHGSPFFQFLPDTFTTSSLGVLTSGTVSQLFMPQNDFLGGVDFWFSNGNSPSTVTLKLYNPSGSLLTTKIVSVPAIPDTPAGGQRVHTDFSQIGAVSTDIYRIQIETADPALRLHYAPRTTVLTHNSPLLSAYQNGAIKIDDEEKDFSSLFAMYETNETSPPVISNLTSSVISPTEVWINFNSNEPVDYKVEYGLQGQSYSQTSQFSGNYDFCASGVDTCRRQIPVAGGTAYEFRLTIKDVWGNQSTAIGSFTTPIEGTLVPTPGPSGSSEVSPTPNTDTTPPEITDFRIVGLTNNSVQVAWTTDEAANSYYVINLISNNITAAAGSDAAFELEHFADSGITLNIGVNYRITVTSRDLANNAATASLNFSTVKSTPQPSPSATPSISPAQPSPSPVISSSPQSPLVVWTPSTSDKGYRIDVFDSSNKLIKTIKLPVGSSEFKTDDISDGDYTVVVYASASGAYKKVISPQKLKIDRRSWLEKALSTQNMLIGIGIIIFAVSVAVAIMKFKNTNQTPPPFTQ